MKEFDLSDKELKDLLLEEGLEEPSMGFNQQVLSKIEAFQKSKSRSLSIPMWAKVLYFALLFSPLIYLLIKSNSIEKPDWLDFNLPSFSFNFSSNNSILLYSLLGVIIIWVSIILSRVWERNADHQG